MVLTNDLNIVDFYPEDFEDCWFVGYIYQTKMQREAVSMMKSTPFIPSLFQLHFRLLTVGSLIIEAQTGIWNHCQRQSKMEGKHKRSTAL